VDPVLLASILDARLWYAVPMIVAISLVYGATRHEHVPEILKQAFKAGVWVVGFMAIIFGLILVGDLFI
jgi:hypothetical protein